MKYYNCDYRSALEHIQEDFFINKESPIIDRTIQTKVLEQTFKRGKRLISIKIKPFGLVDKKFWDTYGISIQTLNKYNVKGVKEVFLDNVLLKRSTQTRPIYAFVINHEGKTYYKIYDPLSSKLRYKWVFNGSQNTMLGFDQLPVDGLYVV